MPKMVMQNYRTPKNRLTNTEVHLKAEAEQKMPKLKPLEKILYKRREQM
jgi:hypothetical protein